MKRFLFLTLTLVLLLAGCRGSAPKVGDRAPDFTVKDSDRTVTLSQVNEGKVVLLNFWATWCAPCVAEMPSLQQLQNRMRDQVTVLAVSVDIDENGYKTFLTKRKLDLLTVRDAEQRSNALYGTSAFPETYVIDRNGVIRRKFVGGVDWNDPQIEQFLRSL